MRLFESKWTQTTKIAVTIMLGGLISCRMSGQATDSSAVIAIQNTPVRIDCNTTEGERRDLLFFNLHHDERTSVEAAFDALDENRGTVCQLVHTGGRNISFDTPEGTFTFDPNRIFTDAGARATLVSQSPDSTLVTAEIVAYVRQFARSVVDTLQLDTRPLIIALHNNTEEQYSALSYQRGAAYERDAAAVHLQSDVDPDDFFFVTERDLFDRLRGAGFNVVLQHNATVTDDGSLSVYAAQRGVRYVNVEAQHGHRDEQARMIRGLIRVLSAD